MGLRLATGGVGLVLLLLATLGGVILREGPWNWAVAGAALVCLLEGVDFLLAAVRRGGSWPTPAYALMDFLIPG
jgi:hypothetical protein